MIVDILIKFLSRRYFFPQTKLFQDGNKKAMVRESKAFTISIVTRKPVILNQLLISIMSEINLLLSPINLFFIYAVCYEEINVGKTVSNLFEIALDKIFVSTRN